MPETATVGPNGTGELEDVDADAGNEFEQETGGLGEAGPEVTIPIELPDWVDLRSLPEPADPDVPPPCSLYVPDKRFRPDYEDVPGIATFKSHGVPVKGRGGEMVLVSLGGDKDWAEAMCSTEDFSARLGWKCPHGLMGWACKKCLSEEEVRRLA